MHRQSKVTWNLSYLCIYSPFTIHKAIPTVRSSFTLITTLPFIPTLPSTTFSFSFFHLFSLTVHSSRRRLHSGEFSRSSVVSALVLRVICSYSYRSACFVCLGEAICLKRPPMEKELVGLYEAVKKAADAASSTDSEADESRCLDAFEQLKKFPVSYQILVSTQVLLLLVICKWFYIFFN